MVINNLSSNASTTLSFLYSMLYSLREVDCILQFCYSLILDDLKLTEIDFFNALLELENKGYLKVISVGFGFQDSIEIEILKIPFPFN